MTISGRMRLRTGLLALLLTAAPAMVLDEPASAMRAEQIVVSPSSDLPEVATVSVDASGLQPSTSYVLVECPAGQTGTPCDGSNAIDFTTDGNGAASDVSFVVRRAYHDNSPPADIDCIDAGGCMVWAFPSAGGTGPTALITFAPTPTTTKFAVTKNATTLQVNGIITPQRSSTDETVTVKLAKKVARRFKPVASQQVPLFATDKGTTFSAAFERTSGTCRVTVRYAGNAHYAASRASKKLPC